MSRINFLENNTDKNAVIATPNAGGLGYFSSRRIVNSDGLVNSYDYLNSIKDGRGYYYLKSLGVDYIFSTKISLKFEPYKSMFEVKLSEKARWTNNEGGQLHILYRLE